MSVDGEEGEGRGFFSTLWQAWKGSDAQQSTGGGGGLTSEAAMRKVVRMIDEEKREQKDQEQKLLEIPAEQPEEPDYVATASTMIEVQLDTTEQERADESRKAQISTLSKAHTTNLVVSFVMLLLVIVLFRQT